jgi:hypothetical protein
MFFHTTGLYSTEILNTTPLFSDDPAGEEAGGGGPGLRL